MKKRLLSLILVVLLVLLSACSSDGNDVSRAYDEALNAMKQGNYTEAVDKLAGISFYQDSAQLSLYCRAHAKAAEGDYGYAVEELQKLGAYRDAAQSAAYFAARKAEAEAETPRSCAYAAGLYDEEAINGFRDSQSRAASIRTKLYEEGLKAQEAESWADAADCFGALGEYRDSETRYRYTYGRLNEADGERAGASYAYAAVIYNEILDYLDSADRKKQCIELAYQKADQLIAAADKAEDLKTATVKLAEAEGIYNTLDTLCDKDKLAKLDEARARAAEADRQRLIAKADALLAEKQFEEARELYLEAEEPQMASEALYLKAEYLAGEGKPEEAAARYREIFEYKDSREKHYLLGSAMKETDPETASRILQSDIDYPGAEDDLYEIAQKATEAENYPFSISVYGALTGKRDCSLRMMNDLYLYGQRLLQEENPGKAASVFDQLKGVGSADLYANMARYAAAEALEQSGSYEAAAAAFDLITDYADAADRADHCRYQLAAEKKKNGQYLEAAGIFAALGGLEDSAGQAKECRYLQAGVYADRQSWEDAIELYKALNGYAESKTRCMECYRQLGLRQMADGLPEKAYRSFVSAGDKDGQAKAAFAVGEAKTAELQISEALKWYSLAPDLPETEERTAMIAQSLLNMEEDELSERYASVVSNSEKAQNVLYALALRSLERKDEEAAMRQMKKAGDNTDASERFRAMLSERVETLISEEKYDDAIFLCNTYGEQERAEEIRKAKAEKEEAERQEALKAEEERKAKLEEAERQKAREAEEEKKAKLGEAENLLKDGKYDEAAVLYTEIGETELAAKAVAEKEDAEKAVREERYQAGKALIDSDPEGAFRALTEDLSYADVKTVLYGLADRESKAGNYRLSYEIFAALADLPLDPENPMPDCRMRSEQDMYLYGLQLQQQEAWDTAAGIFDRLADFGSAQAHALECRYAAAEVLEKEGKYSQAALAFEKLEAYSDAQERTKQNRYSAAKKQMESGSLESAAAAFENLGNYSDAAEMAKECRYQIACGKLDSGAYAEARDLFAALGDYSDSAGKKNECVYQIAEQLMGREMYDEAIVAYETAGDYPDAAAKAAACRAKVADLYIEQADAFLKEGKTDQAIVLYQSAYSEYEKNGDEEKIESLALRIADCWQSENNLNAAIEWLWKARKSSEALKRLEVIAEFYRSTEMAPEEVKRNQIITWVMAEKAMDAGDYQAAVEYYQQIMDPSITKEREQEAWNAIGEACLVVAQYDQAKTAFETAGNTDRYRDVVFMQANVLKNNGQYEQAYRLFNSIRDYDGVKEILLAEEFTLFRIKAEDIITFGHYEQDNDLTNGPEEIQWIVLEVIDDKALLLSKYGLDVKPYNAGYMNITWENCSIRAWLNDEFRLSAFTAEEQNAIMTTEVDNSMAQGYSNWNTEGGDNTQDQIFLLSYAEANYYLGEFYDNSGNIRARLAPTDYAIARKAWVDNGKNLTSESKVAGRWWLRSPGHVQNNAAGVNSDGSLHQYNSAYEGAVVRPAFWVDLKSSIDQFVIMSE